MEAAHIERLVGYAWLGIITLSVVVFFLQQYYKASVLKFEREKKRLEQEKQIAFLNAEKEKQRIAFSAAVEAEEKQKARIANNLHDEIIHLLIAIKHQVDETPMFSTDISKLLNQTISGIKSIALELIPKVLLKSGLIEALEQHALILNNSKEKIIELENETTFNKKMPFSKNDEVSIYRICLEILNNLLKHAHFTYLQIHIENTDNALIIEFRHNGKGVNNGYIESLTQSTNGLGLKSLQSRLFILNASINYSIELEASIIHVMIPYNL